ncbi:DUF4062 domain-containing protein [Serratia fonticola]|uniref:DUF4062 domain-containing protein n=1 Tax=Serratia fonticola TaxID=47917 RepID=UPI001AE0F5E3|nr:DUF4062 domain-containing protein [Serratia fonticola]MBP1036161.1 DUF4062 domain-containing protein [Serratia fonticola]
MDKRYQVFVSSTFTDLEDERKHVIQTLMEMDCIPAGMELFPAIDEEQWEFIKRIIDDCDYYLLIIGGRYGTVADDGLSYTEKEFDYAVSKGLKVIVLVHENPGQLPVNKSELNPESRDKLTNFITKASDGRLRKTWANVKDLPGLVALSMTKTIKTYPAVGWVRANKITNEMALSELNELRKRNEELLAKVDELENKSCFSPPEDIASFDSIFKVNYHGGFFDPYQADLGEYLSIHLKWSKLFSVISPFVVGGANDNDVVKVLEDYINKVQPNCFDEINVDIHDIKTIYIQFKLLGLLDRDSESWKLSPEGNNRMMLVRVVKQ